ADGQGCVCVRLIGFTSRVLNGPLAAKGHAAAPAAAVRESAPPLVGELTLRPVWDVVAPVADEAWPAAEQAVAIIGGTAEQQEGLRARYRRATSVALRATTSVEEIASSLQTDEPYEHLFWTV